MKAFIRRFICILITAAAAAALCAVPASAASAKLNKKSLNLPVNSTYTLKVSGTSKDVKWSSSDSSVAAVKSSDGKSAKIVGKKAGTAYIYAKADGVDLKCKITVKKTFITAGKKSVSLEKGETAKVTITAKGSKKDIAVSSSDKSVCTASLGKWNGDKADLTITAKKNGTAKVKVYTKGASSSSKTISVNVGGSGGNSGSQNYVVEFTFDADTGEYSYTIREGDGSTDSGKKASTAEDVVSIVNKERAAAGLPALKSDPTLNKIAELRAKEISAYFSHTRPNGTLCTTAVDEAGFAYNAIGENIAAGNSSASSVMKTWMSSSGHKENILSSDFSKIGVGLYVGGEYGYYWVQVFTG